MSRNEGEEKETEQETSAADLASTQVPMTSDLLILETGEAL